MEAMTRKKKITSLTISFSLKREKFKRNFPNNSNNTWEQVLMVSRTQVEVEVIIIVKINELAIIIINEEAGVSINATKIIKDNKDLMINRIHKGLRALVIEVEVSKAMDSVEEGAIEEIEIVVVMTEEMVTFTTKITKATITISIIISTQIIVDLIALGVEVENFSISLTTMVITKSIQMKGVGRITPKTASVIKIWVIRIKKRG